METTALALMTEAMAEIGAIGESESLTAGQAQFGLRRLNQLVNAWQLQSLTILTVGRNVFTLVANQSTYTIGEGGTADFDVTRPTRIENAGLLLNANTPAMEIPLSLMTDDQYAVLSIKDLTSQQPTRVYYNPTMPLGTVFLWPTPTTAQNDLVLYTESVLAEFAALATPYDLAPAYTEALMYQLALRLASPYGRAVSPLTMQMAMSTLDYLKRTNVKQTDLSMDPGLTSGPAGGTYNILSDSYTGPSQ